MGWVFVGGLPPFLSPHPCPSPTPSLSETLKVLERGIRRRCLPVGFVFALKVPTVGSLGREPEVEWSPPFFRFGGDRLRSAPKRGLAALPNEASASCRYANAAVSLLLASSRNQFGDERVAGSFVVPCLHDRSQFW